MPLTSFLERGAEFLWRPPASSLLASEPRLTWSKQSSRAEVGTSSCSAMRWSALGPSVCFGVAANRAIANRVRPLSSPHTEESALQCTHGVSEPVSQPLCLPEIGS